MQVLPDAILKDKSGAANQTKSLKEAKQSQNKHPEQPLQTENFSDKADRLKNENCQRDLHAHTHVHMHKCLNSRHNDSSTRVSHLRVMGWLHGAKGPA